MSEDLRPWLAEIGLEQYAEIFVANDIDLYVLPDLSDDDLKRAGAVFRPPPQAVVRDFRELARAIAADHRN